MLSKDKPQHKVAKTQTKDTEAIEEELLNLLKSGLCSKNDRIAYKAKVYLEYIDTYIDNLSRDTLDCIIDDLAEQKQYSYSEYRDR